MKINKHNNKMYKQQMTTVAPKVNSKKYKQNE